MNTTDLKQDEIDKLIVAKKEPGKALKKALSYIPTEEHEKIIGKVVVTTMVGRLGLILGKGFREDKEIIFISERIVPTEDLEENHPDFRFFVYIVLHEMAHFVLKHKCRRYDQISDETYWAQETDATVQAMQWYKIHIECNPAKKLAPLSQREIDVGDDKFLY